MIPTDEVKPRNPGRKRAPSLDEKTFQSEFPDAQDFSTKTSVEVIAIIEDSDEILTAEEQAFWDQLKKKSQADLHDLREAARRRIREDKTGPIPSLDIDPEFRPKGYIGPPNTKEPGTAQAKHTGDGGSTPHQYGLPLGATELQDLIEHRHMNFSMGNIFKACYRSGTCSHSDERRDLRKIIWFAKRELARLL